MSDKKEEKEIDHKPGQYLLSDQSKDNRRLRKDTDYKRWPDKFKEEYCEDIVEFMSKGKSLAQWATKNKISSGAIRNWLRKYPHFSRARDDAIQANMAYWESIGERGTVGQIPGFRDSTYRFMMKNRFPHVYKDIHHTENTTTIKFETFVNEYGQIEQTKENLIEGEVIEDSSEKLDRKST